MPVKLVGIWQLLIADRHPPDLTITHQVDRFRIEALGKQGLAGNEKRKIAALETAMRKLIHIGYAYLELQATNRQIGCLWPSGELLFSITQHEGGSQVGHR